MTDDARINNRKVKIVRITATERLEREDTVVREQPLTILLNDREMVTTLCSPEEPEALAAGWLGSEGLLRGREDIKDIAVDAAGGTVRVVTVAGVGPDVAGPSGVKSAMTVAAGEILSLVGRFQRSSLTYLKTHGVHNAALCDNREILVFAEDIGRHNAIDKVFGRCLLDGIPVADRIVITSGRVSSEILLKVARWRVPVIVSVAAPTDAGVALAGELGMTLVGLVREQRMNVYTHDWRVK